MKCPVCADPFEAGMVAATCISSSGDQCTYEICQHCASWTFVPSAAISSTPYPDHYYGANDQKFISVVNRLRHLSWWRRARQVHRLHQGRPGDILDIGCGDGIFLQNMRKRGWKIYGTELAGATFIRASSIEGIDLVQSGESPNLPWPDASMDAITIWHALEHIANPVELIRECRRVLKNEGFLIVEVPNVASLQARLFKSSWFHLDPPRHITQFSRRGLHALLERSGMPVVRTTGLAVEMGVYGFIQSALNTFLRPRDLLFDTWCKGRFGQAWGREILSGWCCGLIFPLAVLAFTIETLMGAGCVVKCRAVKNPG